MNKRLLLQSQLEKIVGMNVYFQPPASVKITYPCVIYSLDIPNIKRADGSAYIYTDKYEMIFIYKKPNMEILEEVLRTFPMCSVSRVYIADNLYHYAFNLYY